MTEPFGAKASPKTLKQQLSISLYDIDIDTPDEQIDDIIKVFKEWLTQKRPTICADKPCPESVIMCNECVIDRLLEELNQ